MTTASTTQTWTGTEIAAYDAGAAFGAQRERDRLARLADDIGAVYRTGRTPATSQCPHDCPHRGIGNQVDGHGSHLHPFAELIGREQ